MKTFKDIKDDMWTISITVDSVIRIRSELKLDMLDITEGGLIMALADDQIKFFQMLWILCEEEVEKKNMGEEDFAKRFNGDTIELAMTAFTEALIDFFQPAKRETARKLFAKTDSLVTAAYSRIDSGIEKMNEKKILDEVFEKVSRLTKS